MKKILIVVAIAVLVLLGCIFVYKWQSREGVPATFKGPTGVPSMKGPSSPPPGQ